MLRMPKRPSRKAHRPKIKLGLLSVQKISQACPGTPEERSRARTSSPPASEGRTADLKSGSATPLLPELFFSTSRARRAAP